MAAKGIAGGYPDGTFRPNANVTRAQFAALLIRTLGITEQAAKGGRRAHRSHGDGVRGQIWGLSRCVGASAARPGNSGRYRSRFCGKI
jgi:hypothetical protein